MGELWSSWTFYIHLQNTNDWSYESYYKLFKCDHLNQAISLNNELGCEMLKKISGFCHERRYTTFMGRT